MVGDALFWLARMPETVDFTLWEAAGGYLERCIFFELEKPFWMYRASLIAPEIDDFPGIGFLNLKEVKAAQKCLGVRDQCLMLSKMRKFWGHFQELQTWLQTCVDSGRDLICFYA